MGRRSNVVSRSHNKEDDVPISHVMKISPNGRVSIPADVRARWHADRVIVVDLGDRVVLRPMPADPVGELEGVYRGRGQASDLEKRRARSEDAASDRLRSR